MNTPQQTLERAYAALNAAAFAHPSAADDIGTQCSEAAEEIRALLAQPAAAPPAPGGDVLPTELDARELEYVRVCGRAGPLAQCCPAINNHKHAKG